METLLLASFKIDIFVVTGVFELWKEIVAVDCETYLASRAVLDFCVFWSYELNDTW